MEKSGINKKKYIKYLTFFREEKTGKYKKR